MQVLMSDLNKKLLDFVEPIIKSFNHMPTHISKFHVGKLQMYLLRLYGRYRYYRPFSKLSCSRALFIVSNGSAKGVDNTDTEREHPSIRY